MRRSAHQRQTTWERPGSVQVVASEPASTKPRFRVGQRVAHEAFGEGMVLESRGRGDEQIVTVNFEDAGQKRLMASLAPMEVLEG
jgi:DNA helicase-2/ATP-dependent DNA helicase PcrA